MVGRHIGISLCCLLHFFLKLGSHEGTSQAVRSD